MFPQISKRKTSHWEKMSKNNQMIQGYTHGQL